MAPQRPSQQTSTEGGPQQTEQSEDPGIRTASVNTPESKDTIEQASSE
jgi:hypothetical protein